MHLVVGTPCYGGVVTQRYMQSVCSLLLAGRDIGLSVSVELLGYDSLVTRSRNTLVSRFLDTPGATHLMFIDADIGFSAEQVLRMLRFDREVVAGLYPLKIVHYDDGVFERFAAGESLDLAQLRYVGVLEDEPVRLQAEGFATGVFAGCGFMLIARSALEKMIIAYPETRYRAAHNTPEASRSLNQYALFDCVIEPSTGDYLSEDYTFCHRWRAIGGQLWLDLESRLMHVGPREFAGDTGPRFAEMLARGSQARAA